MRRWRGTSTDDVPIRDYVEAMLAQMDTRNEQRFVAQEKAIAAALASSDKANATSEANAEKWRQSANEWRGAMSDRDRQLPSRREVETAMTGLGDRLRVVEQRVDKTQDHSAGKSAGVGLIVGAVLGAVGLISAVVAIANAVTG
jgi:hypothetical protein